MWDFLNEFIYFCIRRETFLDMFTCPKNANKTRIILTYCTWLNRKTLNSEYGQIQNIQVEIPNKLTKLTGRGKENYEGGWEL